LRQLQQAELAKQTIQTPEKRPETGFDLANRTTRTPERRWRGFSNDMAERIAAEIVPLAGRNGITRFVGNARLVGLNVLALEFAIRPPMHTLAVEVHSLGEELSPIPR
jgi:hypothetical protein